MTRALGVGPPRRVALTTKLRIPLTLRNVSVIASLVLIFVLTACLEAAAAIELLPLGDTL